MSVPDWKVGALAFCLVVAPRPARACTCGVGSPNSALTARDQTWGIGVGERVEAGRGSFGPGGAYRAFRQGERATSLDLSVTGAWRPLARLELAARSGYGRSSATSGGTAIVSKGPLEPRATARFDAVDQAMSWAPDGAPVSVSAIAGILVPLPPARRTNVRGLRAFELSLGGVVERAISPRLRVGLSADGAARLPDRTLGFARRLGPRVSSELTVSVLPDPTFILSGLSALRWEGEVTVDGERVVGTASRAWEIGAGAAFRGLDSPFRSTATVRCTPPLSGVSINAASAVSLELSVAFTR